MDVERFETLALAYGGDLRRWPQAERAAGEAFRAREPAAADEALSAAQALDFALDGWTSPAPSAALRQAVLAAAPKTRARPAGRGLGFWLSGAGLVAAAAAGVIVGFTASTAAVSNDRADAVLQATLPREGDTQLTPFTLGETAIRTS